MLGGNQPADIRLIHRRCNRLVPHHPKPLVQRIKQPALTKATISVPLMPMDDAEKRRLAARIRRWVKTLRDAGYEIPGASPAPRP